MTTSRTIDSYGGVYTNEQPVANPTTEQSAAFYTRHSDDSAQMTRTTRKVFVRFPTTASAAPVAVTPTDGRSHMGVDGAALPTVGKTATGRYTVTYPVSWTDDLGVLENIGFTEASGSVQHLTTFGHVQCTVVANVIYVSVCDMAGSATDLGGAITLCVSAS